ncbi:ABC transporter permease [Prodigiosinella confusarubida]|uniref:Transport permease protein n=2 Tax=Serratia sp. (strain ATCC 39006) TaxID=104623 RepID=A0A2I5TC77_SERS3|nr:ABC transporter permease [Serratia sp. ATCC 39006]AUH06487.1 ABC transporter permease [Serratia sp. ATCC 39006]
MPLIMLRALWNYRGFILGNVKREFQSKYRNSLLGATWTVLNPLAMIIVYTVIFSHVMKAKIAGIDDTYAYSIYLCSGVLTWGLFSEIVSRAQNVFIDNANLLKKVSFPRMCLPVVVVANALINFIIIFSLFTVFLLISGENPGFVYFSFIPVLIIVCIFSIGLGITLGVLNVFFRDVGQLFNIILQFWFWFTPIVYPINALPENIRKIISLNPMTPIISAFQSIFVLKQVPKWDGLILVTIISIAMCFLGMHLFRKHVGEMVDEL